MIAYVTVAAPEVQANNHYQNARTTFHGRALIVQRVMKKGMSASEVAEQLGISSRTVYKWVARYKDGGREGLHNRGYCPQRGQRRVPVETVAFIAAVRRPCMTSPAII